MKKSVSAWVLGFSALWVSISVQAGQTTVVVAPNSIQSAEYGFTFKSTENKEYFGLAGAFEQKLTVSTKSDYAKFL